MTHKDPAPRRGASPSRRAFAAAIAGAPVALAQPAPQPPATASEAAVQNPVPPGVRPATGEAPLFAEPLVFSRREAPRRVMPFPMTQVRLLPGPCLEASEANRAYMLRLGADRLLHTFRLNAGLPTSAKQLGGWEDPKSELRGHFTGHYLSACALRFASAGDLELKARGDEIVAGLAQCQEALAAGGYLSAFPIELFNRLEQGKRVWAPFYTIHKIMAGLLDMYLHAGNRQALEVASSMADWADRWSDSKGLRPMQQILKEEFGGMSDVLYNLASAAHEDRWAAAGDRFHKLAFVTPLAERRDELRNLHTNTHIPQVIGAARRFELTSDVRFRDAAEFFWYTVVSARTYATGGSSNAEAWLTNPGHLSLEWKAGSHHQECCCAYNMMKLTRQLYSWSGEPRYFDYYERNLFNHRLGTIERSTGHSTYFLSLTPGAWKTLNTDDQSFWCCTGSALEEYAKLNDSIYYHGPDGITVNLFVASELNATRQGVRLRQETRFPDEPATGIVIQATPEAAWTLRLRIPAWTTAARVKVNGKLIEATSQAGSYLSLTRVWKKGDRIDLEMPMRLTVESLPDDPGLQAFLYGPIVLAGDLGTAGLTEDLIRNKQGPQVSKAPIEVPALRASGAAPEAWIKPDGSSPLSFRIAGTNPPIALKPLHRLWGRFAVYWRVSG